MKRIALVVLLAWLGFFVGWPAWSGYRIKTAIENEDAALLDSKIDFPAVRASLKPVVTAEVERTIARALKDAGALGGLISNKVRSDLAGRMVDNAIDSVVTPANIIQISHDRKSIREAIERVTAQHVSGGIGGVLGRGGSGEPAKPGGGIGGLGGILEKFGKARHEGDQPKPAEAETKPAATPPKGQAGAPGKRRFGITNLKRISITGPLSFSAGVVRDPVTTEPEVTAEMRFTGFDWKVVSMIPRLEAATQ